MAIVFYKDLPLDFTPHPVTGDIRPVTDTAAIRRSIENLIKTKRGERPFRPDYGSNIHKYLFESGALSEDALNRDLYDTITRFETRVIVTEIQSKISENGINVKINYVIRNTNLTGNFSTAIKRVT